MSDTNSAAAPTAAAPAAPVAQPPATPPTQAADAEPAWLPGRLQRERESFARSVLADLGVQDIASAKAELAAYRETAKKLPTLESEVTALRATLSQQAAAELSKLSEEQRQSVKLLAGDDPARQLDTLSKLRPVFAAPVAASPSVATPTQPAAPQPLPVPASTSAPAAAPAPATPSQPNHLAVWQGLQKSNPIQAAYYYARHSTQITAAQKAANT